MQKFITKKHDVSNGFDKKKIVKKNNLSSRRIMICFNENISTLFNKKFRGVWF